MKEYLKYFLFGVVNLVFTIIFLGDSLFIWHKVDRPRGIHLKLENTTGSYIVQKYTHVTQITRKSFFTHQTNRRQHRDYT